MSKSAQLGFSLIETAIVLAIVAVIIPAFGVLLVQLVQLPPRSQATLSVVNEAQSAQRWLNADGARAQSFVLGASPDYGTFAWHDFTLSSTPIVQARYYYEDDRIRREEKVNGTIQNDDTVARGIASFGDLAITACPTFVSGSITATSSEADRVTTHQESFFLRFRPEPWGELTTAPLGYAVFASGLSGSSTQGVELSQSSVAIVGNAHSDGDVSVSGTGHSVSDALTASGTISVSGTGHSFGSTQEGVAVRGIPFNCAASDLPSPTFSWGSDVDLSNQEQVWQDWPTRTKLEPGVYLTTGKMTLDLPNVTGVVTLVGDQVEVTGAKVKLWPYYGGVTVFATGSGAQRINITAGDGVWRGALYAPNGEASVSPTNGNLTLYGSVIAQSVKLSGQGLRIIHSAY